MFVASMLPYTGLYGHRYSALELQLIELLLCLVHSLFVSDGNQFDVISDNAIQ